MNKLVIVGNGFDLAHELPTSYKHFIDDFWKNIFVRFKEENIKKLVGLDKGFESFPIVSEINNYNDFSAHGERYIEWFKEAYNKHRFFNIKPHVSKHNIFYFKSNFFELINTKNSIENWVDIENEYYLELKKISKRKPLVMQSMKVISDENQLSKNNEAIKKLNFEFEQIKKLFELYLSSKVKAKISSLNFPDISDRFFDFFDMTFVTQDNVKEKIRFNNYLLEFSKKDHPAIIKYQTDFIQYQTDIGGGKRALEDNSTLLYEAFFLNFNYTDTTSYYNSMLNKEFFYCSSREIKIHGELNNNDNEINFGFGDEMDEDYRLIENLNDNEYLKNFKSFKYSQNNNYKDSLDFIDSEKFQVYIMGHSCGISDRTLLNTIFEHKNCRSIKVFYHKREDGSDNFTDIIQNISRHFNDKKLMRSKIVNKSLCEPLPQNIRFQEKNPA